MEAQLSEVQKQLEAATARAKELFSGLSDAQLVKRPDEGRWSVAECVRHLSLTTKQYEDIFNKILPSAPKGTGPFKMDFKGKLLSWVMEPSYRAKVKTTAHLEPSNIASPAQVLADFDSSQRSLTAHLAKADGIALDQVKITSPYDGKTTYNLLSCFSIIMAHQRRHLWQGEQVKKKL